MRLRTVSLVVALAACPVSAIAAPVARELPAAIFSDPPIDTAHPATGQGVQFDSHGALVNAQLYRPAGEGAHPTVVLLHGLPGNEQNLDLARAIQRAGWTVITFHYRGAWGSAGTFSLKGGAEDADALLVRLRDPAAAGAWGVDPKRIVVIGHSYGGFAAAHAVAAAPEVIGVGLIAPWDPSFDARQLAATTLAQRQAMAPQMLDDVAGRLGAATPQSVLEEIFQDGHDMDLAALGAALAHRRVLVLTAMRDDAAAKATGLLDSLRRSGGKPTAAVMETDHGFNDHRISLEVAVLRWLESLPGAPSSPAASPR